MELSEQLKQIQEAIAAVEIAGQEYQIGSRRIKRGDLKTLYEREKALKAQIEAENGSIGTFANTSVAYFDRR